MTIAESSFWPDLLQTTSVCVGVGGFLFGLYKYLSRKREEKAARIRGSLRGLRRSIQLAICQPDQAVIGAYAEIARACTAEALDVVESFESAKALLVEDHFQEMLAARILATIRTSPEYSSPNNDRLESSQLLELLEIDLPLLSSMLNVLLDSMVNAHGTVLHMPVLTVFDLTEDDLTDILSDESIVDLPKTKTTLAYAVGYLVFQFLSTGHQGPLNKIFETVETAIEISISATLEKGSKAVLRESKRQINWLKEHGEELTGDSTATFVQVVARQMRSFWNAERYDEFIKVTERMRTFTEELSEEESVEADAV